MNVAVVVDVVMKIFEPTNLCMQGMRILLANIWELKKSKRRKIIEWRCDFFKTVFTNADNYLSNFYSILNKTRIYWVESAKMLKIY